MCAARDSAPCACLISPASSTFGWALWRRRRLRLWHAVAVRLRLLADRRLHDAPSTPWSSAELSILASERRAGTSGPIDARLRQRSAPRQDCGPVRCRRPGSPATWIVFPLASSPTSHQHTGVRDRPTTAARPRWCGPPRICCRADRPGDRPQYRSDRRDRRHRRPGTGARPGCLHSGWRSASACSQPAGAAAYPEVNAGGSAHRGRRPARAAAGGRRQRSVRSARRQIVNRMLGEIETLIQEIAGVGDNIAHDLRTPLTRVRVRLERGRDHAQDARRVARCRRPAVAGLDQSLGIITALLRIAEIEHSRRLEAFSEVAWPTLVREVAELYDPIAEESSRAPGRCQGRRHRAWRP